MTNFMPARNAESCGQDLSRAHSELAFYEQALTPRNLKSSTPGPSKYPQTRVKGRKLRVFRVSWRVDGGSRQVYGLEFLNLENTNPFELLACSSQLRFILPSFRVLFGCRNRSC